MTEEELDSASESAWQFYLKSQPFLQALLKAATENEQGMVTMAWQLGYRQCLMDSIADGEQ